MLAGDNVTTDFAKLNGPGVTLIEGAVEVTAEPSIVAVIELLPAIVPVNVAVYVPLSLSVTGPIVPWPPLVLPSAKSTFSPPVVSLLPAASSACNVIVEVLPDAMLPEDNVTTELAKLTGPGVTVIEGAVEVTAEPPIVALIVLLPAIVPV
jgi:hypothetical protein